MDKTDLAIPNFLAQWRTFRGLTQPELADKIGMSVPSVSQHERGIQGFSNESLAAYAQALQCSPADIYGWDPTREDSFWPLFQAAEKLKGADREMARRVIIAALGPAKDVLK